MKHKRAKLIGYILAQLVYALMVIGGVITLYLVIFGLIQAI